MEAELTGDWWGSADRKDSRTALRAAARSPLAAARSRPLTVNITPATVTNTAQLQRQSCGERLQI